MGFTIDFSVLNQKGTPALYTDTFANRPAFGYAGRLFIANDTAAIYEDTGTAWVLIANVSSGAGTLQQVTTLGNTSNVGISVTAGGVSTNSATITSLTTGSVPFVGAAGLITQDNTNLFFDDTNNRLGINTNTPTNNLDVHGSGTIPIIAINNTAGNQSLIGFAKNSTAKWRIGNSSSDTFDILNVSLTTNAITISLATNIVSFIESIKISQTAAFQPTAGFNSIIGTANGFGFQLGTSTITPTLSFNILTASRNYIFPDAAGTIALTTDIPAVVGVYLPLTGGTLTGALIGTTITAAQTSSNAALNINNSSLSGKNWQFTPNNNSGETDLQLNYTGTGASAKITFANGGNIGIGTTNPAGKLDVFAGANQNLIFKAESANQSSLRFNEAGNGPRFFTDAATEEFRMQQQYSGTGFLTFYTGSTEKMRITPAGNVGIGTTDPQTIFNGFSTSARGLAISNGYPFVAFNDTDGGNFYVGTQGNNAYIWNAGTADMSIATNNAERINISSAGVTKIVNLAGTGSRAVIADASGNLSAPVSDETVKENIQPLQYGLNAIMQLNPISFEYIDEYKNYGEGLQIGNIAQDVAKVIPEAVFTTPSTGLMGINYNQFDGIYIKAIQELNERIELLLSRIEYLENK